MRRAGTLASIMARDTGLWKAGDQRLLDSCLSVALHLSPGRTGEKQGQDIHFLSFYLGRVLPAGSQGCNPST